MTEHDNDKGFEIHISYIRKSIDDIKNQLEDTRKEIRAIDEKFNSWITVMTEKQATLSQTVRFIIAPISAGISAAMAALVSWILGKVGR